MQRHHASNEAQGSTSKGRRRTPTDPAAQRRRPAAHMQRQVIGIVCRDGRKSERAEESDLVARPRPLPLGYARPVPERDGPQPKASIPRIVGTDLSPTGHHAEVSTLSRSGQSLHPPAYSPGVRFLRDPLPAAVHRLQPDIAPRSAAQPGPPCSIPDRAQVRTHLSAGDRLVSVIPNGETIDHVPFGSSHISQLSLVYKQHLSVVLHCLPSSIPSLHSIPLHSGSFLHSIHFHSIPHLSVPDHSRIHPAIPFIPFHPVHSIPFHAGEQ